MGSVARGSVGSVACEACLVLRIRSPLLKELLSAEALEGFALRWTRPAVCGVPGPVRAFAVCAFCASRGLHAVALAVAGLFRGAGVLSALVAPASKVSRRTTVMMRCGTRNWTTKTQARVSSTTPKKKAHSEGKRQGKYRGCWAFR